MEFKSCWLVQLEPPLSAAAMGPESPRDEGEGGDES